MSSSNSSQRSAKPLASIVTWASRSSGASLSRKNRLAGNPKILWSASLRNTVRFSTQASIANGSVLTVTVLMVALDKKVLVLVD